jgi:hypothetical protein
MRHGIVEGEPGIFPQPIADFMRKIGNFFDRRRKRPESPPPEAPPKDADKSGDETSGRADG